MKTIFDGQRFRIPASRRLTWDLLWFHKDVPLCAHDRKMDLKQVAEAREACAVRIGWPVLFLKAFAIVARDIPELRQTWYRWPWSHLYQHPNSVGTMTVHREIAGVPWLFWGLVTSPDDKALSDIQEEADHFRDAEPGVVFRKQRKLSRLPTLIRRAIWWWNLNIATHGRASRIGTFFLSTLSSRGAEIQLPPSVHTCCLTYGPLDEQGVCRVTIGYDHRVMDGALIATVLQRLEETLKTVLGSELSQLTTTNAKKAA
jgi:hypothetical protein